MVVRDGVSFPFFVCFSFSARAFRIPSPRAMQNLSMNHLTMSPMISAFVHVKRKKWLSSADASATSSTRTTNADHGSDTEHCFDAVSCGFSRSFSLSSLPDARSSKHLHKVSKMQYKPDKKTGGASTRTAYRNCFMLCWVPKNSEYTFMKASSLVLSAANHVAIKKAPAKKITLLTDWENARPFSCVLSYHSTQFLPLSLKKKVAQHSRS